MRIEYKAIKPIGRQKPPAYADICAHTNDVFKFGLLSPCGAAYATKKLYGSDVMTSAHETTHGINNDIANGPGGHRSKCVGLYGLDDIAFYVPEPGITITDVARKTPKEYRGGICQVYDLYLVKQAASWGDRPLYLADEWYAYTNGAIVALQAAEAGDTDPNRWSEIQNAIYFNAFMGVLWETLGPTKQNDEIFEMMKFNYARVHHTFTESDKLTTLQRPETNELLDKFYSSKWFKPFEKLDKLDYGTEDYL